MRVRESVALVEAPSDDVYHMDNSPLNAAHHQHRRAELSMRQGRYDEAIQRHLRAAELMEEALKLTTSNKAAESIKLQIDYHRKQKDIIKLKKEQQELFKRAMEKREFKLGKLCNADVVKAASTPESLKLKVNNIMNDADSLVDILVRKYQMEYNKETETEIDMKQISIVDAVYKDPKSDKMVMEELKTVNHQLREVITQLLSQLDTVEQENKDLKKKIAFLESDTNDTVEMEPSPQPSPQNNKSPLAIIMDSAEDSSPFIYSPSSDLSPDLGELKELPPLAPLEMPDFNYGLIISQLRIKREQQNGNHTDETPGNL